MAEHEWKPVRRRWFVERRDFGQTVAIVQTVEDANGIYRFLRPVEVERASHTGLPGHSPFNVMTGNEPFEAFYTSQEAQELMDALWTAGLRPTRC